MHKATDSRATSARAWLHKFLTTEERSFDGVNGKWSAFFRNIGLSILFNLFRPYWARGNELPKIIVNKCAIIALIRCIVHIIPISVTIVLAYFNLSGYFVGNQLTVASVGSIAADALALQIAAKIQELLVVASLTIILLNVVRNEAMSEHGIPFGLLSAGFNFHQLSFLWSPSFLLGGWAISQPARRIFIMLLIAISGLLAAFIGPSSALLMIPAVHNQWPAGATAFYLIGNNKTLWPDHLNANHIGGSMCLNPTSENISTASLPMSGCIWHGTSELMETMKDRHFDWQANITVDDGVVKRQITRSLYRPWGASQESWALGVDSASARLSRVIADQWGLSIATGTSAQGTGRYTHYKEATNGAGVATVDSWLPVVRVSCNYYNDIGNSTANRTDQIAGFPVLPLYDALNRTDPEYYMLNISLPDFSHIMAEWVTIPTANILTTKGRYIDFPTAFAFVKVPYNLQNAMAHNAALFACSIDARWAMGGNIGTGLVGDNDRMIHYGSLKAKRKPGADLASDSLNSFLPIQGPYWRSVSIDNAWLSNLVPHIPHNSGSNWTTLAQAFTAAGFDNSTGIVSYNWTTLGSTIETAFASVVVDGMSRVGLSANGGNMYQVMNRYDWIHWINDTAIQGTRGDNKNRMLRGEDVILPPTGVDVATNTTKMQWSVTIAGLAYEANSLPYYLALSVLLLHTLIASLHMVHMLWTRRSSDAWQSFEEMLVLSQNSRPPRGAPEWKNTCGGIRCGATMQRKVRVAYQTDIDDDEEAVQLIFERSDSSLDKDTANRLQENVVYGAGKPWTYNGETKKEVHADSENALVR